MQIVKWFQAIIAYLFIIITLLSTLLLADGLRDGKSPQVTWTLISIPADLNAVVWMVLTYPLISNSSNFLTKPLGIIPSAPITIGITITFILHRFYSSQPRFKYLSLFFFPLIFSLWSLQVFPTSINWWSFTGVWMTASLLRCPVLFSVVWPISTMPLIWRVLICPLISISFIFFSKPLRTIPSTAITIDINITLMFHWVFFFSALARSKYLLKFLLAFIFTLWSAATVKSTIKQILFLLLIKPGPDLLDRIRWSVFIS